jgi:hypothetical protein
LTSAEPLFLRVERERGFKPPGFLATAEETMAHCRRVWAAFPAWGYDEFYVAEVARPLLPRILAQMNLGQAVGRVSDDTADCVIMGIEIPDADRARDWSWRWVLDHAPRLGLVPLRGGSEYATGLMFKLPEGDLLVFDQIAHDWRCPSLARVGDDLIALGEWRWSTTRAKAAWRIARLCGLQRPVP